MSAAYSDPAWTVLTRDMEEGDVLDDADLFDSHAVLVVRRCCPPDELWVGELY